MGSSWCSPGWPLVGRAVRIKAAATIKALKKYMLLSVSLAECVLKVDMTCVVQEVEALP